jgi:hypothetical protein
MCQEYKPMSDRHCCTCIQWEGARSWDKETKLIKVDEKISAHCLLLHKEVRGVDYCERFFPIA